MTDLFAVVEDHETKHTSILLIDASGSVMGNQYSGKKIFEHMLSIIQALEEKEFRVIFWNSDHDKKKFFNEGIYKLPFVVKNETLPQTFMFVQGEIKSNCLTYPHLGFDAIPEKWINNVDATRIYFVTDGKIGYDNIKIYDLNALKRKLGESINKIFRIYNNVQLNIITVEPVIRNFNQIETLTNAAGCDVYNVVMDNRLTKYITKFVSYTPNNSTGFIHISKNIPPPGFVPFEDRYFSQLRVGEFIEYLAARIKETSNENKLLKIVQSLSATLSVLTKDKPKEMITGIIRTFCELFNETSIDPIFAKFILTTAIEKENEGVADIFATYRAQLRNLFKQADELLHKNVKEAIGIKSMFITIPLNDRVITGHSRLVDRELKLNRCHTYPQSAIMISKILVPVLPLETNGSRISDQCLRQWIRAVIGKQHKINVREDRIIYFMLGHMLRVILSDVDELVKSCYRKLGKVMLQKKRLNTNMTELEKLETGDLPIPNSGRIEELFRNLQSVRGEMNILVEPLTLWYAMCLALNNEMLTTRQLIHCTEAIKKDFSDFDVTKPRELLNMMKSKVIPVVHHAIPETSLLDYSCIITLEDISSKGGYRFLPHMSMTDATCSPMCVLSEEGYIALIGTPQTAVCPICYTHLNETNFMKVGVHVPISSLQIFPPDTENIFMKTDPKPKSKATPISVGVSKSNKKSKLVIMKGTVGSGKTSFSNKIKENIETRGGVCIVEGVDKYCSKGIPFTEAKELIKRELLKVKDIDNDLLVVIIDTCGEHDRKWNMVSFDVDFTGWEKVKMWPNIDRNNIEGYLTWSLRNVLRRGAVNEESQYSLNPVGAGMAKCIEVHQKKTRILFGKKSPRVFSYQNMPSTTVDALDLLKERADIYEDGLKSIDEAVEEFVKKKLLN